MHGAWCIRGPRWQPMRKLKPSSILCCYCHYVWEGAQGICPSALPPGAQALVKGTRWIPIITLQGRMFRCHCPFYRWRCGELAQGPPDCQCRAHAPAPQGASPAPCSAARRTLSSPPAGCQGTVPTPPPPCCTGIELVRTWWGWGGTKGNGPGSRDLRSERKALCAQGQWETGQELGGVPGA